MPIPFSSVPALRYNISGRANHRKITTQLVNNTTLATDFISSTNPLTENILPNPLIKLSFSNLKPKAFPLALNPPPTNACIPTTNKKQGIPKNAAAVNNNS